MPLLHFGESSACIAQPRPLLPAEVQHRPSVAGGAERDLRLRGVGGQSAFANYAGPFRSRRVAPNISAPTLQKFAVNGSQARLKHDGKSCCSCLAIWHSCRQESGQDPKRAVEFAQRSDTGGGVAPRTVHGLGKSRLTAIAEAVGSVHAVKAWGGHATLTDAAHSTASADTKRLLIGRE